MTIPPRLLQNVQDAIAALRADKRGSVSLLFGITAIPALLLVGASVEYANALRIQAKLQSAADTGVIAGVTAAPVDCNMIANADGTNCGDGLVKATV